ncbi:hypothetical protein HPB47_002167 [Ixodes persulcatus]|uniref:Uncharacterized protein n=1 Tax=Ixodes persulcatus TaxID=34615 RepID=A0AC60PN87_IXOPE|nr:hypothetical protein HPB47_002167 [Ixodes persulcatus]
MRVKRMTAVPNFVTGHCVKREYRGIRANSERRATRRDATPAECLATHPRTAPLCARVVATATPRETARSAEATRRSFRTSGPCVSGGHTGPSGAASDAPAQTKRARPEASEAPQAHVGAQVDTVDDASDSESLVIDKPAQRESPASLETTSTPSVSVVSAIVAPMDSFESPTSRADSTGATAFNCRDVRRLVCRT